MRKPILLLVCFTLLSSHDMFLKLDAFHLAPNTASTIKLFNGTFSQSDNIITRDRMIDVSLVGNGQRIAFDTNQWKDIENTTVLDFKTGADGTWIAGVSTKARNIDLEADDFNNYLEHDGVLDMLEWRKENNKLEEDAIEKYSKHVKTCFQVGNKRTEDWKEVLGYPIEFIPLNNPYETNVGDSLKFKLLWQNLALADQLVYGGYTAEDHVHEVHSHEDGKEHHHHDATQYRTNSDGIVSIPIAHSGDWFVRTIHMALSGEEGLTHESNWATFTWGISDKAGTHTHADGTTHSHDNDHNHGMGQYLYWLICVLVLLATLFMLRKKSKR